MIFTILTRGIYILVAILIGCFIVAFLIGDRSEIYNCIRGFIRYDDKFVLRSIRHPYFMYKKMNSKVVMDTRYFKEYKLSRSFEHLYDIKTIRYDQVEIYLQNIIDISKRLVLRDGKIENNDKHEPQSEDFVYEKIFKFILNELHYILRLPVQKKIISDNKDSFVSFIERNKPETIPARKKCPKDKEWYYKSLDKIIDQLS